MPNFAYNATDHLPLLSLMLPSRAFPTWTLPKPPGGSLLDIDSNLPMLEDGKYHICSYMDGNYSKCLNVGVTESATVSGMNGCGSVFLASANFSRIAAAHTSGALQFNEDWCDELEKEGNFQAIHLIVSTSDEMSADQDRIDEYKDKLNINNAIWVKQCGSITVQRVNDGAVLFAGFNPGDARISTR